MDRAHYCQLAALFDFPGPSWIVRVRGLVEDLKDRYPEAATEVRCFLEGMPAAMLDQQELYTRTFDVQAITTLDIGYILFGDDYKRAALLSHLTREHRQAGTDCRGELADHLPNVLRLLHGLADEALVAELVRDLLVPALMLMLREFDPERIEKKNGTYQTRYKTLIAPAPGSDPAAYRRALAAVLEVVRKDFAVSETIDTLAGWSTRRPAADFLGLVEKEMEIETRANPANSGRDA